MPIAKLLLFLGRDFDTSFGSMEGIQRALNLDGGIATGKPLLGAFFGFTRAVYVDLGRPLSCFGENRHLVRQDLGESPGNREVLFGGILAISDLADGQLGDERSVSRKNPQIAVLSGNLDFFGRRVDHFLFRRDDLELESICHGKPGFGPQTADLSKPDSLRSKV